MAYSYQKATLYGDGLTDYVWIHDIVDSQTTIDSTLTNTYAPTWDVNTLLLAPFTSNINGGNITSVTQNIINWWIYKQSESDSALIFVAKVPVTQNTVLDYNVLANTGYKYTIFAETSSYLSAPLQSEGYTSSAWWNWSIVGMKASGTSGFYYADSDNVWLFDTNLSSGDIAQNLATYTTENFTQFPKINMGVRNYKTGTITCLINNYDFTNKTYADTIVMQNNFEAFVNSEEPKLLRDRKGNGYIVQTVANSFSYEDDSIEQITKISFQFTQIGKRNNVQVIGAY